jgi:hypothetical protein
LLGLLLFAVACVITAVTDEGSVSFGARIVRTLPALPACGAAATLLLLRRAEGRGELLALATLGSSPARSASFTVAAAASLSVLGAILVTAHGPAADAFFPRPPSAAPIRMEGDAFVDDERGVRITQDGTMTHAPATPRDERSASARKKALCAALVLLGFGIALSMGAARRLDIRAATATTLAVATCVFLLQAAATGHVSPALATVPPLLLLIGAAVRYRAPQW